MSLENIHFQRLWPYPGSWLVQKLLKTPVTLYRLGLGKVFGNYILILSTKGRKSGKIHRTPVEYFYHEGKYYIISGFGPVPDWYQNILTHPQVTIQNGYERICATARPPQTEDEWEAIRLYLTHSPIGKLLKAEHHQANVSTTALENVKQWPALTFDPTDKPCPPPLEADLVWAWPLILLVAALNITFAWLLGRRK